MQAIEYKGQKVITTAMLAQAYETSPQYIRTNFGRNKNKFVEGRHYYLLQGDELKRFKSTTYLNDESLKVNRLYLWTERGANHHCKILGTDKAWEQFENLEETYFRVKNSQYVLNASEGLKYLNGVANYLRVQKGIMKDKGCSSMEIAQMSKLTCDTFGIPVPDCIVEPSTYQQLVLTSYNQGRLGE